jgi:hypothetical protein
MDYSAVPPPTNYGAPNVFAQGQGNKAPGADTGQQIGQMLQKAKSLLSSGQISADQYNQLAQQYGTSLGTELATSAGNMGQGMPQGAPMNILPGVGG